MNITELHPGQRVLLQSDEHTRETAEIKSIDPDTGAIQLWLPSGKRTQATADRIIKAYA